MLSEHEPGLKGKPGERDNVPHIATNEDKVWQQMRFREKPDERLEPLLTNYRALRPQKDKA